MLCLSTEEVTHCFIYCFISMAEITINEFKLVFRLIYFSLTVFSVFLTKTFSEFFSFSSHRFHNLAKKLSNKEKVCNISKRRNRAFGNIITFFSYQISFKFFENDSCHSTFKARKGLEKRMQLSHIWHFADCRLGNGLIWNKCLLLQKKCSRIIKFLARVSCLVWFLLSTYEILKKLKSLNCP